MSDCLDVLEREKRYPSDELLTAFIRYQLVADEAQKLLVRDVMGDPSPPPTYIFRKSWQPGWKSWPAAGGSGRVTLEHAHDP